MKNLILNIIDEYIKSGQMQQYLKNNADKLRKSQITNIICGACVDINKKYETLKKLAELGKEDDSEVISYASTAEYIKKCIDALKTKDNEIFIIKEYGYDEDIMEQKIYGAVPSYSFQKTTEYIKKEYEDAISNMPEEEIADILWWWETEKYFPDNNGNLESSINYTYAPNGEIWFANFTSQHCFASAKEGRGDLHSSRDLNLPVPFEVGDIITIDCRPFAPIKHGVIIKKGDNIDCCCVQCAWIRKDGDLSCGALKHGSVFDMGTHIQISPLYRAEVFSGELPENEKVLKEVAEFVRGSKEKGTALCDFIVLNDLYDVHFNNKMLKQYLAENVEKQ